VLEATDREAVRPVVVVRGVHVTRIEVQVVGVRSGKITRPVVAVRTLVVDRGIVVVPVAASAKIIFDSSYNPKLLEIRLAFAYSSCLLRHEKIIELTLFGTLAPRFSQKATLAIFIIFSIFL